MTLIDMRLAELKLSKEVVDIFRDGVGEDSLSGVILDFNKSFIVLGLLTEFGEDDGVSIIFVNDVSRIRSGGNERESLAQLSKYRGAKLNGPTINIKSINAVIESIQAVYGYVNIQTEYVDSGICFIGEVKEQDDEWVSLLGYGTMTTRDSNSLLLDKKQISRIDAGGKYEESIKFLFQKN